MRDITRGGLATVLSELAEEVCPIPFSSRRTTFRSPGRSARAAEILGIDPLYLACEGRAVLIAPQGQGRGDPANASAALPLGRRARIIGRVQTEIGPGRRIAPADERGRPAPARAPDLRAPAPHLLKIGVRS